MRKATLTSDMGKVLSFGELLLRICPDAAGAWLEENKVPFYVGGAELNVATALARWDVPSAYFTAIPENFLSQQLLAQLQKLGIDTSKVQLSGHRTGLYYLHKGKDLKHAGVIYDRENSSFSTLQTGSLEWDSIFKDVSWFHFSAICPALNQELAGVCEEALHAAAERGIYISLDLNYREKLWKYGQDPRSIMPKLAQYCSLIMGNIWAAENMLGIKIDQELLVPGSQEAYIRQAEISSKEIMARFPKCSTVANTFRFDEDQGLKYYTTLYKDDHMQVSKVYRAKEIIDKVGSGDCFMAGLIYGFFQELPAKDILDFATAAAFTKLFVQGDATTLSKEEILVQIRKYEN
jgi:2-dehydro-3-deoxygluconokinase